jgi:hypothetical protein
MVMVMARRLLRKGVKLVWKRRITRNQLIKEHGNTEVPRKDPYKELRQLPKDTTPPNVVRRTSR